MAKSRLETNTLAKAQAEADANRQLKKIQASIREDVLDGDTKQAVKRLGLESERTASTNDANKFITLYHAYDGRELPIPMYQVAKRLQEVFPRTAEYPEEFWDEQVWLGYPPDRVDETPREAQCRLSPNADEATKAEMKAAGLAPTCRKKVRGGGFATQFEADEHFRVKHPRRWKSYERFQTLNESRKQGARMDALMTALVPKPTE